MSSLSLLIDEDAAVKRAAADHLTKLARELQSALPAGYATAVQELMVAQLHRRIDAGEHVYAFELAFHYLEGIGVVRDERRAFDLLCDFAMRDDKDLQHALIQSRDMQRRAIVLVADLVFLGRGTPRDTALAMQILQTANKVNPQELYAAEMDRMRALA